MRRTDPLAGIVCKLPKSDGYHTWTDQEIAQYRARWPLGTAARLAMELALETTSRRGDVTRVGPQRIRNGAIHIRHTKNRADVVIPVTPELQGAIDAMPTTHLTFLAYAGRRAPCAQGVRRRVSKMARRGRAVETVHHARAAQGRRPPARRSRMHGARGQERDGPPLARRGRALHPTRPTPNASPARP
jgi:hypothetical protein